MVQRLLIGSPIRQKPQILKEFLNSLLNLNLDELEVGYCFIDDNTDTTSKRYLELFSQANVDSLVLPSECDEEYICDEKTHYWHEKLIWKVASFKDSIIQLAVDEVVDWLFLIDSDLVLHPNTIKHLISTNKDIVSEIFWTQWTPDAPELPQVWLSDQYTLVPQHRQERLSPEDAHHRTQCWLAQLRQPGVYSVGGLGACTLISQQALLAGVNYREIPNVSFWGEDRHFCIRAMALGFDLFVDTHYPAYHIYREAALPGVSTFKQQNGLTDYEWIQSVDIGAGELTIER